MKNVTYVAGRLVLFAVLHVLLLHSVAVAGPSNQDPMSPLQDLVGSWQGSGWIRTQGGEVVQLRSQEVVEARLEGEALLVEGLHHDRATGEIVHHALGLLSWDMSEEAFRFQTRVAGRSPGNFKGWMDGSTFVWGGPVGPGEVRYRITVEDDRWQEVGLFSNDGESWDEFFEMSLERTDGPGSVDDQPLSGVDALSWMAGSWVGSTGVDPIEEMWTQPAAGRMLGAFRWRGKQEDLYELFLIEERSEGIVLLLKHFGPGLKGWEPADEALIFELEASGPNDATFARMRDDGSTTRIHYRRDKDGRLVSELESENDGEVTRQAFTYVRAPSRALPSDTR